MPSSPFANPTEAEKYDLSALLNGLLQKFVLWTPQQREELEHFYTNKQALETGSEDLWGSLMRIAGYRVDICPIYASYDELFEAFMYHDPKNGKVFKQIMDEWMEKNAGVFEDFKQKLADIAGKGRHSLLDTADDDENEEEYDVLQDNLIMQYPKHEQFFMAKAMAANPAYFKLEECIEALRKILRDTVHDPNKSEEALKVQSASSAEKKARIRDRIKDLRMILCICPNLEQWILEEEDQGVLLFLRFLLDMKIYDRNLAYARYRILWDKKYWDCWRKGG